MHELLIGRLVSLRRYVHQSFQPNHTCFTSSVLTDCLVGNKRVIMYNSTCFLSIALIRYVMTGRINQRRRMHITLREIVLVQIESMRPRQVLI